MAHRTAMKVGLAQPLQSQTTPVDAAGTLSSSRWAVPRNATWTARHMMSAFLSVRALEASGFHLKLVYAE